MPGLPSIVLAARGALIISIALAAAAPAARAQPVPPAQSAPALAPRAAAVSPIAHQALMLGAAWAGTRSVAVGEQGIVLLSDDQGASQRQAAAVPVASTLTSVSFADARHGWAVGHWGAILATDDGGQHWRIQRLAPTEDRPLFSVHFFDARNGVAVGLWSLVLTTDDGGANWTLRTLPPPPGERKADLNLLHLFADAHGNVFAAAERGMVLRSTDRGASWTYLATGYKGSFWSGIALADGTLLVGGQRGTVYRSSNGGQAWQPVELNSKSSVTGFAQGSGEVLAVGLDGLHALSRDGGRSFSTSIRPDRMSLTAALRSASGKWLAWSRRGLLADIER